VHVKRFLIIHGSHENGFTLIKLMVVIAGIGLLAAIAVPHFSAYREKGKVADALADLKTLQLTIELLAIDTNS